MREALVSIVLKSALSVPEHSERYLRRLCANPEISDAEFEEAALFSGILARSHPELLARVTSSYFKEKLPEDLILEEWRRQDADRVRRARPQAKGPADLAEPRNLPSADPTMFHHAWLGLGDWEQLSLGRGRNFFPASPLREPFASLFKESPDHALALVADLGNHAITAWRQLNSLDREKGATPLPLDLDFPWGTQTFWGGTRQYLWGRGVWGPQPLQCGFLALEDWAIAQLEAGTDLDALIERIVAGHQGIAILLVAVALALQAGRVTEAVLPLLTSQRVLAADKERFGHDLGGGTSLLIGFDGRKDGDHIAAVRAANARPARRLMISNLIPVWLVHGGPLADRMRAAIALLPGDTAFETEEQRQSADFRDGAARAAAGYRELSDPANTRVYPAEVPGAVVVVHESPSATEPESLRAREKARRSLEISRAWIWASKCIDGESVASDAEVARAIALGRELDDAPSVDDAVEQGDMGQRQGAMAGIAAVCLAFRGSLAEADLLWARDVVSKAAKDFSPPGAFNNPKTHQPWHHAKFAAHGLAAEAGRQPATSGAGSALLRLAGHPLHEVSLAALRAAFSVWDADPRLGWCALLVKLTTLEYDMRPRKGDDARRDAPGACSLMVAGIVNVYERECGWPALPIPPHPWRQGQPVPEEIVWDPLRRSRRRSPDGVSQGWYPNPVRWNWQLGWKILELVPARQVIAGASRAGFLDLVAGMLAWSLDTLHPPWAGERADYRDGDKVYEFTSGLGRMLGTLCGYMPLAEAKTRFLDPVFALPDDACWELLAPLLDWYVRVHVMDANQMPQEAPDLMMACAVRVLADPTFSPGNYRRGDLHGFQMPKLVDTLFLVNSEEARAATRFANGDWTDIGPFIPAVDLVLRTAGWSPAVMSRFLHLCERAQATYPASLFADEVLAILDGPDEVGRRWQGLTLPARLAGVVQSMADRDSPMEVDLSRKLLRVLDHLVDMGDRRAAALQSSEAFRQVAVSQPSA